MKEVSITKTNVVLMYFSCDAFDKIFRNLEDSILFREDRQSRCLGSIIFVLLFPSRFKLNTDQRQPSDPSNIPTHGDTDPHSLPIRRTFSAYHRLAPPRTILFWPLFYTRMGAASRYNYHHSTCLKSTLPDSLRYFAEWYIALK